jgi:hypothetical protein
VKSTRDRQEPRISSLPLLTILLLKKYGRASIFTEYLAVAKDYFTLYLYSLKSELSATNDTKIDRAELADTPPRQFALTTPTATMSTNNDFTRIDRLRVILGG